MPDLGAAEILAATATVSLAAGAATWSNQFAHRQAVLLEEGEYLLTLADAQCSDLEIVDRLRSSLIASPELANYGFIRTTQWSTIAFHHFLRAENGHVRPQEAALTGEENPWANSARWQQNYHLHGEYAFDAHALNLLTSKHLDKASDLSDWSITGVGHDRYVVEARDLRPWFDGTPDSAVLQQARRDFGDMLITWDVVLQRPGPKTVYPRHLPQPQP